MGVLTEGVKILEVWNFSKFIWCLLLQAFRETAISDVVSSRHCFGPKVFM